MSIVARACSDEGLTTNEKTMAERCVLLFNQDCELLQKVIRGISHKTNICGVVQNGAVPTLVIIKLGGIFTVKFTVVSNNIETIYTLSYNEQGVRESS